MYTFTYISVTLSEKRWSASMAGRDAIVSGTEQRMTLSKHAHDPKHETLPTEEEFSRLNGSVRNSADNIDNRDE